MTSEEGLCSIGSYQSVKQSGSQQRLNDDIQSQNTKFLDRCSSKIEYRFELSFSTLLMFHSKSTVDEKK